MAALSLILAAILFIFAIQIHASNAYKDSIVRETKLERWNLRNSNGSIAITGVTVPGVVHTHL